MRRDPDVGATWLYGYGRGQGVARERSAHERRKNTGDLSIYNRTTHDARRDVRANVGGRNGDSSDLQPIRPTKEQPPVPARS